MIRQLHLRDRFVMAQSTLHVVIGNRGRPIHHDKVINRLRERGIHFGPPAQCQVLTRHKYLLHFFLVSVYYIVYLQRW